MIIVLWYCYMAFGATVFYAYYTAQCLEPDEKGSNLCIT